MGNKSIDALVELFVAEMIVLRRRFTFELERAVQRAGSTLETERKR